jgi:protein-tyrosine-phosphatase
MTRSDNKFRVLFVCTGNTCRSPMAAAALLPELPAAVRDRVGVASAGTGAGDGAPMSPAAREALVRAGLDAAPHASRRLTAAMLRAADLVLAMEPAHARMARELEPAAAGRVHLLGAFESDTQNAGDSVHDPYGGSAEIYDECLARIRRHTDRVARHLLTRLTATEPGGQSDVGSG